MDCPSLSKLGIILKYSNSLGMSNEDNICADGEIMVHCAYICENKRI